MNSYFSHDSNARNSKKILRLRRALGAEGYGTYFMLLERLREEQDFACDADYEMLSFDLRVDADIIKSVVEDFGLFLYNEDRTKFYSDGFNERMNIKDKRTEAGRKGAEARWGQKSESPSEMAQNGKIMANALAKDICHDFANSSPSDKEKESKENISSLTPPLADAKRGDEKEKKKSSLSIKTQILLNFFERNFLQPEREYEALVNYNNVKVKNWDSMTDLQKMSAAKMWEQRPAKPPRLSPALLHMWLMLVRAAKYKAVPEQVIMDMLSDKVSLKTCGTVLKVCCAESVYQLIENEMFDEARPFLKSSIRQLSLTDIEYECYD